MDVDQDGRRVLAGNDGETVAAVESSENNWYVFAFRGGAWRQIKYGNGSDGYGETVAVADQAVVVGDRLDDEGGDNAGAVRVHGIEPICLRE